MPSTYTTNTGIEKPGIGEQTNTWGVTANTSYDILDRAVNGVVTLTLTGTASTLTTTDGILSDGQYKVLVLGGAIAATHTITISPNDAQKLYLVYNTTSQSVIITQGSGASATILTGDSAIIYANGAGAAAAVANLADHLGMSSPRIVGGSISGLSTPLAVASGGTGGATQADARTGIGLGTVATLNTGTAGGEVRTNTQNASTFQPLDATLTAYAGASTGADILHYFSGTDAVATTTLSTYSRTLLDDTSAGAWQTTLGLVIGTNVQAAGNYLVATGDELEGGFTAINDADGTISSGTYTPTPVGGNFKSITNGGAFTFAAPGVSGVYTLMVEVTNNATAGTITFSGFGKVGGESLTTTDTNKFQISVCKTTSGVTAIVQAMQ